MPFLSHLICRPGGRETNEDYCDYASHDDRFCWALADGLGGHRGGEIAARVAVETVLRSFHDNPGLSLTALNGHLLAAQTAVLTEQRKPDRSTTMRSTLVVMLSDSRQVLWGHLGDSRLYWFRRDQLVLRTKDHSVPQILVDAGDIREPEIRNHPDRSRLLNALGGEHEFKPEFVDQASALKPGDTFLLCSDGFWEPLGETDLVVGLVKSTSPHDWLQRLEHRLLERVEPGYDNYAAIGVFWIGP